MRTHSTEFPDFVLDVIVPSDFVDTSWHNDTCPSFAGHGLRLWIDYKDPAMREVKEGERFVLQREDADGELQNDEESILLETGDWSEMLTMITTLTCGKTVQVGRLSQHRSFPMTVVLPAH